MAERKLWWNLRLAVERKKKNERETKKAEFHRRVIARQYKLLCDGLNGRDTMTDIEARRILRDKHKHDLSYLTKILRKEGAL